MNLAEPIVYGADWCADCHQLKALLDGLKIAYEYRNIDDNETFREEMLVITNGSKTIPTLVYNNQFLQEPSAQQTKELLEIALKTTTTTVYDVLTVGAGPAALSAAIYTTREDLSTVLYEKGVLGGLAAVTDWVDNYPGFPKGIAGLELADALTQQAERFGAKIELGEVTGLKRDGDVVLVETTDGAVQAHRVLVATGSDYKKAGVPGERECSGQVVP